DGDDSRRALHGAPPRWSACLMSLRSVAPQRADARSLEFGVLSFELEGRTESTKGSVVTRHIGLGSKPLHLKTAFRWGNSFGAAAAAWEKFGLGCGSARRRHDSIRASMGAAGF